MDIVSSASDPEATLRHADFSRCEDLCALQDLVPLHAVCTSLREGLLDLTLTASAGWTGRRP